MPYKFNPITGKFDYYQTGGGGDIITPWSFRRSGRYYTYWGDRDLSTMNPSRDYIYAMPFIVPVTQEFDRIAFKLIVAQTNGAARLGIYNDEDVYPSSLVIQTAEIDCSGTTGQKEETISEELPPGLYWLAINTKGDSNLTVSVLNYHNNYSVLNYMLLGYDWSNFLAGGSTHYKVSYTYGPLPDSFPAGATMLNTENLIAIWLRKA